MPLPDARERSRSAPSFAVDPLEQRTLFTFSTSYESELGESGPSVVSANLLLGDNGDEYGVATSTLNVGGSEADAAWSAWDESPWDGIESEWEDVAFAVSCDGGTSELEFNGDILDGSANGCTSLGGVRITAGVAGAGMSMEWDDVEVLFYRDGLLVETVVVGAFAANLIDGSGSGPLKAVTLVTPGDDDYDAVVVTGSVRLRATSDSWPLASDIFGQVQIV
jgi:hypothetical protein